MTQGFLVLENKEVFPGLWQGKAGRAGEIVFNTSHSGYEEIATDPSYFNQILVTTAPMQGNYGVDKLVWESQKMWINGFVCLDLQQSPRDNHWQRQLLQNNIPILSEVDTRRLVLCLRDQGTPWGALVSASSSTEAREKADVLIKDIQKCERDWAFQVSRSSVEDWQGDLPEGPRIAVLDFGCKINILRELKKRCREIRVFPSRTSASDIRSWNPDGILLSNGPGDPQDVKMAVETVRDLLGWKFIFGICMGHQILALALGAKTYKLKFGHRGSNHPVKDHLFKQVYVTSQNHGYSVTQETLPKQVQITHTNLNDQTVSGMYLPEQKCLSVQFHPESHPGPHDAETLFDYFVKQTQ